MTVPAGGGPVLAISPHLDDAVMSVGASLAALVDAGYKAIVCTVFAGSPQPPFSAVAAAFHADCGQADDAVDERRGEDLRALEVLGGEAVHLHHLDAVYRRHRMGWLCETPRAMFDPSLPDEADLREAITADVEMLVRDLRPATVWTCAAGGGHVDHRLVRTAVSEAGQRGRWAPVHWEELPYAIGSQPAIGGQLLSFDRVDDASLGRKLAAIQQYPSQIRMLWQDGEDWRAQFLDHARTRQPYGAPELLWWAPDVDSPMRPSSSPHGGR